LFSSDIVGKYEMEIFCILLLYHPKEIDSREKRREGD
jgi:hypothetical protein